MLSPGKNNKKSLRASNVELHSRDVSVSKDDKKIIFRDYDNLGPLRQEKVINNSHTGKRCANMMSKFIAGIGVSPELDIIINKEGESVSDLIDYSSSDIAYHYGVWYHKTYDIDVENSIDRIKFKRGNLCILDYVPVAKSQGDDNDYPGKIYFLKQKENSEEFLPVDENTKWYYPYNENPKVIKAQMHNDCKIAGITNPTSEDLVKNYRGQVYYLNLTPKYDYALPLCDVAYDDMDTEYRISRYGNNQSRKGWLGKTVITTFDDEEEEDERSDNSFDQVIKDNMGADNSENVLIIKVPPNATDDVKKAFNIDQVKAQFDDKLFEKTIENARRNIMGAFNNIPEILVSAGSGALFGPNSETYKEAKKFYWEQNDKERSKLEKTLSKLLGFQINILPFKGIENELPKS